MQNFPFTIVKPWPQAPSPQTPLAQPQPISFKTKLVPSMKEGSHKRISLVAPLSKCHHLGQKNSMQEGPNASRSPMWISAYINSYILAFGPSCIEFFHPRCWCFDNGAKSETSEVRCRVTLFRMNEASNVQVTCKY